MQERLHGLLASDQIQVSAAQQLLGPVEKCSACVTKTQTALNSFTKSSSNRSGSMSVARRFSWAFSSGRIAKLSTDLRASVSTLTLAVGMVNM